MAGLVFHHLGLAVRQSLDAVAFLSGLGYALAEPIYDENQNVHAILATHSAQPTVEIIYPGPGKGPLDKLIGGHRAGLIYHACYTTDDLPRDLAALEAAELRVVCVSPPKKAPLFGGRMVSFYEIVGVGLIEIIH